MKKTVAEKYRELSDKMSEKCASLNGAIPSALQEEPELFEMKVNLIHRRFTIYDERRACYEEAYQDIAQLEMELDGWRRRAEAAELDNDQNRAHAKRLSEMWDRLRMRYGRRKITGNFDKGTLVEIMHKIGKEITS